MLVGEFLIRSAARYPDKLAIIAGDSRVSYEKLDELSNRVANALTYGGVRHGDRVAVLLDNRIEAAAAIFGILKAGAVFVVISQTIKADKLSFILNDCEASAVVMQSVFSDLVKQAAADVDSVHQVLVLDGMPASEPLKYSLAGVDALTNPKCPVNRSIDVDVAALIYTSGSTGFPKGVAVSHLNVVSAATSITTYLGNVPEDLILNALPLSFDYGLYQLLMSVKTGATLVLEKSFAYPFRIIERIRQERVTGFPGVPTIFAVLLQMKDVSPENFDSVRYVSNTAAALPPAHIQRLRDLFRNAKIFSMYGLTECKRVSYLPPEELDRRPTSVGKGMPNERVWVVDENGLPAPPGEVGELVVSGSNVMLGYWNRPEETERMVRPGKHPWERVLYTGDLFKMDEDGFLYFVARKDDIIKSRGEKVSPVEVERVICERDEVREAAVVGVPDKILGSALKAFVVLSGTGSLTHKELIFHCAQRLESYMVPKIIEFCEELPLTSSGKVRRRSLEDRDSS